MTAHINGHAMHANSMAAHAGLTASGRAATRRELILAIIQRAKQPVTAAEVQDALFKRGLLPSMNPNLCAPRCCDLVDDGLLVECPSRICRITGTKSRTLLPARGEAVTQQIGRSA